MLAEQAELIHWTGREMPARGFPPLEIPRDVSTMRGRLMQGEYISPEDRLRRSRSIMGQNWIRLYQGPNRKPMGTGTIDVPPVRFDPLGELAYLRMRRRRRDVKRRAAFAQAGMGLRSLFS